MEGTFDRIETKYLLDRRQYDVVRKAAEGEMRPDSYGRCDIASTYWDTDDRSIAAACKASPDFKEKVRVRDYRDGSGKVFLELKSKWGGSTHKRRVRVTAAEASSWLSGRGHAESGQIADEVDAFLDRHGDLVPSMEVVATRVAWEPDPAGSSEGLRLTFDEAVECSDLLGDAGTFDLLGGKVIMEVKAQGAIPLWLARAISSCGAVKTAFSKYGKACDAAEPRLMRKAA